MTFTLRDLENAISLRDNGYGTGFTAGEESEDFEEPDETFFYAIQWPEDTPVELSVGTAEFVESDLIYENGDPTDIVIFKIGERFFKASQYHDSWGDADENPEYYEVKPVEKTITVYEAI